MHLSRALDGAKRISEELCFSGTLWTKMEHMSRDDDDGGCTMVVVVVAKQKRKGKM